jgi:hypothetical protein
MTVRWFRRDEIGEPPYTAFRHKPIDLGSSTGNCACCGRALRYVWKFADGEGRHFALGRDCYRTVDDLFVRSCREAQERHVARLGGRLARRLVARDERIRRQQQIQEDLRRQKAAQANPEEYRFWIGSFGEKYLAALVEKYKRRTARDGNG